MFFVHIFWYVQTGKVLLDKQINPCGPFKWAAPATAVCRAMPTPTAVAATWASTSSVGADRRGDTRSFRISNPNPEISEKTWVSVSTWDLFQLVFPSKNVAERIYLSVCLSVCLSVYLSTVSISPSPSPGVHTHRVNCVFKFIMCYLFQI